VFCKMNQFYRYVCMHVLLKYFLFKLLCAYYVGIESFSIEL
jgi:hypothetical protein